MCCVKFRGDLPREGSLEKFNIAGSAYVIKKYVISGQNVMTKHWRKSSKHWYNPTQLCFSVDGVTGSLTASLCAIQLQWDKGNHFREYESQGSNGAAPSFQLVLFRNYFSILLLFRFHTVQHTRLRGNQKPFCFVNAGICSKKNTD